MFNKKILLSLLTVGLLACVASAATWAYFQDTLDVNNTRIATANLSSEYALVAIPDTPDWVSFSGDTGHSIGPFNITNLIPFEAGTLQIIKVRNMGSTSASVVATITPTSLDEVANLKILVGNVSIYDGHFNSPSSFTVPLSPVAANGADSTDASISYVFDDIGSNQNSMENKSITFDMSIAVKAIH